jgi:hypothetical protein
VLKVLLVVLLFAVATYALIRVIERRGVQRPIGKKKPQQRPTRPVAPDDDEDFLRDLDRKRRHPEDPEPPSGV